MLEAWIINFMARARRDVKEKKRKEQKRNETHGQEQLHSLAQTVTVQVRRRDSAARVFVGHDTLAVSVPWINRSHERSDSLFGGQSLDFCFVCD